MPSSFSFLSFDSSYNPHLEVLSLEIRTGVDTWRALLPREGKVGEFFFC